MDTLWMSQCAWETTQNYVLTRVSKARDFLRWNQHINTSWKQHRCAVGAQQLPVPNLT
eukprot:c39787_g1_i1 orf=18-191(-)